MPIGQLDGQVQQAVVDPTNTQAVPQVGISSTMDGASQTSVPLTAIGLVSVSGTKIDRLREDIGPPFGSALVSDPTLQDQMEMMMAHLRTIILLMLRQNTLLGGMKANAVPAAAADDPDLAAWLAAAIAPFNTIIDLKIDPFELQ